MIVRDGHEPKTKHKKSIPDEECQNPPTTGHKTLHQEVSKKK